MCVCVRACSGTFDIYVEIEGKPKLVGNYDNAGFFGELALMYNMPRAATIVATSNGLLWALVCLALYIMCTCTAGLFLGFEGMATFSFLSAVSVHRYSVHISDLTMT